MGTPTPLYTTVVGVGESALHGLVDLIAARRLCLKTEAVEVVFGLLPHLEVSLRSSVAWRLDEP
jgi:hypothetical protein